MAGTQNMYVPIVFNILFYFFYRIHIARLWRQDHQQQEPQKLHH